MFVVVENVQPFQVKTRPEQAGLGPRLQTRRQAGEVTSQDRGGEVSCSLHYAVTASLTGMH